MAVNVTGIISFLFHIVFMLIRNLVSLFSLGKEHG